MEIELKEVVKVGFAVAGAVLLLYQSFALVAKNAPLRVMVNPTRRPVLVSGFGLMSLSYGALAVIAGNNWEPADVWHVVSPLFNQKETNLKVIAAVGVFVFGLVGLVGSAVFCYFRYPRDPSTFKPTEFHQKAARKASENALYHYTTRKGGLEYAALVVLPAAPPYPTAEQLIGTLDREVIPRPPYRLIECLDRADLRKSGRKRHIDLETKKLLESRRAEWLKLAAAALGHIRDQALPARDCDLGEITQVRTKSRHGGLLFDYLLPPKDGEPDYILFGVTTTAAEVESGRFEEHFAMLKAALRLIVLDKEVFGPTTAPSVNRSAVTSALPVG